MPTIVVVTPPFTPFDAAPPLGPAILKSHAEASGFDFKSIDLNIHYLTQFQNQHTTLAPEIIGDHAEDLDFVHQVEMHFKKSICLPTIDEARLPCCGDPVFALPHTFAEIESAIIAMEKEIYWVAFFKKYILSLHEAPLIVGYSIMGPAQVPLAMLFAKLTKQYWPKTVVIAGGSHITLLTNRIKKNKVYGKYIDYFLPNHSEAVLVTLAHKIHGAEPLDFPGLLKAGHPYTKAIDLPPGKRLPPYFNETELGLYSASRLNFPLQLRRGCGYSRCTYCTYPVVEEYEKIAIKTISKYYLTDLLPRYKPKRISLKDSLLDLSGMKIFGETLSEMTDSVTWSATTKITRGINLKNMQYLYSLGCRTLEFGIETIHPNTQAIMDKIQPLDCIENAMSSALEAGITVIVNLIFGMPTETLQQAEQQLNWYFMWKARYPNHLFGSFNMLEINEGSLLARFPDRYQLIISPTGPWAFSYLWNAPLWRKEFLASLNSAQGNIQFLTSSSKVGKSKMGLLKN